MVDSNFLSVLAGLLAYCIAIVLGTGPLVYVAYSLDKSLTKKIDEDALLQAGNRSIAIELGTTILCQAILVRHAVFAFMAVIRSLFIESMPWRNFFWVIGRSVLFIVVILALGLGSVQIASKIFKMCMKSLKVEEGIREKNNVAMAIFYALVLLSITLVLNEGMEDFSRSIIPYGRAGVINLE